MRGVGNLYHEFFFEHTQFNAHFVLLFAEKFVEHAIYRILFPRSPAIKRIHIDAPHVDFSLTIVDATGNPYAAIFVINASENELYALFLYQFSDSFFNVIAGLSA